MIFAIRYGFRIQCGVHTTTSSQVISELSILLATTPGQNLQIKMQRVIIINKPQISIMHNCMSLNNLIKTYWSVNNKNSAMSSTYHSGNAVNLHVTS